MEIDYRFTELFIHSITTYCMLTKVSIIVVATQYDFMARKRMIRDYKNGWSDSGLSVMIWIFKIGRLTQFMSLSINQTKKLCKVLKREFCSAMGKEQKEAS
jgi:hypothetical protein